MIINLILSPNKSLKLFLSSDKNFIILIICHSCLISQEKALNEKLKKDASDNPIVQEALEIFDASIQEINVGKITKMILEKESESD